MSNPITECQLLFFGSSKGKHHMQLPEDAKDYKNKNISCILPDNA